MNQITENIYIGSLQDASNIDVLKTEGITHTVCCIGDYSPAEECTNLIYLPIEDNPRQNIVPTVKAATRFITKALEENPSAKILIHCQMGISRAVAVAAGYFVQSGQYSSRDAFSLILSKRPVAHPNTGFLKQINEL